MALKKMTISDELGNTAEVEAGKLTALTVPLEGFPNIETFAKEVKAAMVKTTPDGTSPDPIAVGVKRERKPRAKKAEGEPKRRGKGKDKPVESGEDKAS